MITFLGTHGYNLYVYAPKGDRQHRERWREPYSSDVMNDFCRTIRAAQAVGVTFCYAISPGHDVEYGESADFQHITNKLCAFYQLGVRSFALLLDDIPADFHHAADREHYTTFAAAHAAICNRLYVWLKALDTTCTLSMCPTDYAGTAPFSNYLHELGDKLHPAINVYYTGPDVCTKVIDTVTTAQFSQAVQRQPIIWDNYPVNDGGMHTDMHIGPIRGRDAMLFSTVRGFVVNPMNQAEASKVALYTFADYFADPHGYQPENSWHRALHAVTGSESAAALRYFAENSLRSCIEKPGSPYLESLVNQLLAELENEQCLTQSATVATFNQYIEAVDDAVYHLKYRMDNLSLRQNLLPWIEVLELWLSAGQRALAIFAMHAQGDEIEQPLSQLQAVYQAARTHPKQIGASALQPLIERVLLSQQIKEAQL